jgi:TRAP-type C4-dicarboxylate transport system permease small subunit
VFEKIENGVHYVGNIFVAMGCVMLMILMFLGASDIIGRYIFNSPILGTMEISGILLAGIVLLGLAYTQRMGAHVRVELLISRYSTRARAIVTFIGLCLSLVLFILIVWQSFEIAMKYLGEHRVFQTIPGPSAPYHFLVPIGGFFLCFEFIFQMIHLIPKMRKEK